MSSRALRVLTYHRVVDPPAAARFDPSLISATPAEFEWQMDHLSRRYNVVSANEVIAAWRWNRPLPPRPVLITFDDACRDFAEVAWPILRRHGLSATLFVPTAFPDHPELSFWWDRLYAAFTATPLGELADSTLGVLRLNSPAARRDSLRIARRHLKALPHAQAMHVVDRVCRRLGEQRPPSADVLSWSELRQLASEGVVLGAHTQTHPALTRLPAEEARREIAESREDVRRALGEAPRVFAYPFGDHDDVVVRLVREEGFELGVTCTDGNNAPGTDPVRLRPLANERVDLYRDPL